MFPRIVFLENSQESTTVCVALPLARDLHLSSQRIQCDREVKRAAACCVYHHGVCSGGGPPQTFAEKRHALRVEISDPDREGGQDDCYAFLDVALLNVLLSKCYDQYTVYLIA